MRGPTASGVTPRLATGPELNEHGDAILQELGYDWDGVVDIEVRGVIA